ncbi:copper transporter [Pseudonocardiaceae bacterium YIM PH 21723]|nr:copper transporter [Pseudonocardiaceae bacterium YIM PH 21723]
MISVRYHAISIAAVFLALAVGIVLGSTAISGYLLSGLSQDKKSLGKQVDDLEAQHNELSARLANADSYAAIAGPLAIRGALDQRTVALISTADAEPVDTEAIGYLLRSAGATVTASIQLTDTFTDPVRGDRLKGIVTRLQPAGVQLPSATDPGTLAGGLVGGLIQLNKDGKPQANENEAAAALRSLADGGYIKSGYQAKPAQLAVVLTGGASQGEQAGDRAAIIARFAAQLDRTGGGAVLVGRKGSADGAGPVGVARADSSIVSVLSTVDNGDTAAGRSVVILALREQLEGQSGRYGIAGNAQGPAPAARS